jgi:hypothetical protein
LSANQFVIVEINGEGECNRVIGGFSTPAAALDRAKLLYQRWLHEQLESGNSAADSLPEEADDHIQDHGTFYAHNRSGGTYYPSIFVFAPEEAQRSGEPLISWEIMEIQAP